MIYFDYRVCFVICNSSFNRQTQNHTSPREQRESSAISKSLFNPVVGRPLLSLLIKGSSWSSSHHPTVTICSQPAISVLVKVTTKTSQMGKSNTFYSQGHKGAPTDCCLRSAALIPVGLAQPTPQPLQELYKGQLPLSRCFLLCLILVVWFFVYWGTADSISPTGLREKASWKEPFIDGTTYYNGNFYRPYRFLPPSPISIISERGLSKSQPDFCFSLSTTTA